MNKDNPFGKIPDLNEAIKDLGIRKSPMPEIKGEEPEIYRCEECGKYFDRKVFSHTRTEMQGNGQFRAVECGPITKVEVHDE